MGGRPICILISSWTIFTLELAFGVELGSRSISLTSYQSHAHPNHYISMFGTILYCLCSRCPVLGVVGVESHVGSLWEVRSLLYDLGKSVIHELAFGVELGPRSISHVDFSGTKSITNHSMVFWSLLRGMISLNELSIIL